MNPTFIRTGKSGTSHILGELANVSKGRRMSWIAVCCREDPKGAWGQGPPVEPARKQLCLGRILAVVHLWGRKTIIMTSPDIPERNRGLEGKGLRKTFEESCPMTTKNGLREESLWLPSTCLLPFGVSVSTFVTWSATELLGGLNKITYLKHLRECWAHNSCSVNG